MNRSFKDNHVCRLAKGLPAPCKAAPKPFVKLQCCLLNRLKAQIFFLWSRIDIQQPIKAGGYASGNMKCLMSEELLVTGGTARGRLSVVALWSDYWRWHHGHGMGRLPGSALTSTTQSSVCSVHKHTRHISRRLCRIWACQSKKAQGGRKG